MTSRSSATGAVPRSLMSRNYDYLSVAGAVKLLPGMMCSSATGAGHNTLPQHRKFPVRAVGIPYLMQKPSSATGAGLRSCRNRNPKSGSAAGVAVPHRMKNPFSVTGAVQDTRKNR